MVDRMMWFATREKGLWVKCPSVGMPSNSVGWGAEEDYLNGGAYSVSSTASHKEFSLTWNTATRDEVRPIMDFRSRLYGDGPFFWSDPFTNKYNVLPQWLASPFQGLDDGIILTGSTTRGAQVQTPANTLDYPTRSIRYTVSGSANTKVWVPIPPGHTAWVGVHGLTGTGGTVVATPTTGPTTTGTPTTLTMLAVTDPVRVNHSVDSNSGTNTGVLISLGGSGTVTLSGLMVEILPTGDTPATGGFISGQGHSGCSFKGWPAYTPYSDAQDIVGLVAEFVETEGWAI